MKVVRCGGL
jgi:hypothetical protein